MAEMMTWSFGMAVLAIAVLDLALNPEPALALRRSGGLSGLFLGGLAMLAARAGIGALLFWLVQRDGILFSLGAVPVSLAGLVFLAAGGLLLFRVLSEIIQVSARRLALPRTDAATGGVIGGAVLASVEPAAMGLGLATSFEAIVAGLVLGGALVLVLARPLARFLNRFPHLRLLGLVALAVIGSGMILAAFGGVYPRAGIQGGVLVLALLALGAAIVMRQTGAAPALAIIAADEEEDLEPEPGPPAAPVEPVFDEPEAPESESLVALGPESAIEPSFEREPKIAEPEPVSEAISLPETVPEQDAPVLEPGDRAERPRPPRRPLRRRRIPWRDRRRA